MRPTYRIYRQKASITQKRHFLGVTFLIVALVCSIAFVQTTARGESTGITLADCRKALLGTPPIVLTWPNGWKGTLRVFPQTPLPIKGYIGTKASPGYLSILNHPPILRTGPGFGVEYVCEEYARDTMMAAYRDLGYGTFLYCQSTVHAFNMFLIAPDWQELSNWRILEPQNGEIIIPAGQSPMSEYAPSFIMLPESMTIAEGAGGHFIRGRVLNVDVTTGIVSMHPCQVNNWLDDDECTIRPPSNPYSFDISNTPIVGNQPAVAPTVATRQNAIP